MASMTKREFTEVGVDDIFTDFTHNYPSVPRTYPRRLRAAFAYLGAITLVGSLVAGASAVPAAVVGSQVSSAAQWWDDIEVDASVLEQTLPQRVYLKTSSGKSVATFYSENRIPVDSLDDISDHLIDAVLSIEDRRFYEHGPIDVKGTGRAFLSNATRGTAHGGSSITQQYAKLLRAQAGAGDEELRAQATDDTLYRKVVELKYAAALEEKMSKDEILLGYLDAAYFGSGAYGIGAAARYYFDVPASDLSIEQSAFLAGLLRNPNGYNPETNPQNALNRRNTVLNAMRENDKITDAQYEQFSATKLGTQSNALPNGCSTSPHPYYCDWAKQTLLSNEAFGATEDERAQNLQRGGFTVTLALDEKAMKTAQSQVDKALGRQKTAAAVAVVEPGTGYVRAIAATTDYDKTVFNIPVQGALQNGSAFKPITYAAALSQGMSPSRTITAPHPWVPPYGNSPQGGFKNVDSKGYSNASASTAFKHSINTWFTKLTAEVGVEAVADTAYLMGMRSMDPTERVVTSADLSITLGTFETSVVDTANVYATLAASGVHCIPSPIESVVSASGQELPAPDRRCEQSISAAVADTVTSKLKHTSDEGGTAESVSLDGQVWAGKTGTTNNYGATWFAGYTRHLASAVWVGDPRGPAYRTENVRAWGTLEQRVYGSTIAAPLWEKIMQPLHKGLTKESFPKPTPITVSGRTMPEVVGIYAPQALDALERSGIEVTVEYTSETTARDGIVVSQTPSGGLSTARKATIVVAEKDAVDDDAETR